MAWPGGDWGRDPSVPSVALPLQGACLSSQTPHFFHTKAVTSEEGKWDLECL